MRLRIRLERVVCGLALRAPKLLKRRWVGPELRIDGRRLDLDTQLLAAFSARRRGAVDSIEALRAGSRRLFGVASARPRPGVATHDRTIAGPGGDLGLRVYHPPRQVGSAGAVVWFHQGGGVIGDLDSDHGWCSLLAERAGVMVVSVDYRLAPEHPFPAAVYDAVAAFEWVCNNASGLGVDAGRIAVAGASHGGTLAAVVSQHRNRLSQSRPVAQVLVYPGLDGTTTGGSRLSCSECFPLSQRLIEIFGSTYLSDPEAVTDARVSPGLVDELWGLPKAIIVTAGFDPLRDEGEAYARKLQRAGIPVQYRCEDELSHSFTSFGRLAAPRRASQRLAEDIATLLSP